MSDIIKTDRRQFVIASMAAAGGMLLAGRANAAAASAVQGDALRPAQAADPISLHGASPRLTIHLLDTYHGAPATGLKVDFSRLENGRAVPIRSVVINRNGRSDEPLLIGDAYQVGDYELLLHVDDYFRMKDAQVAAPSFLSQVPVRFRVNSAVERLHLPVQFGPWNYTYYRGS
ncbi:hydroxyisourate hydrolase [Burkholderia cepacia]|uniref:hydroxyisourate hydrolase n=1 Tax=Burkholderia cepacia GG4 TaxID=1009846 RepID=A0A9W3K144_BURCE|nr:hydroxyisourate hydrolase [Burkholderia cepacia]AFQ49002.1 transthyretin family protein [Burkholderia cepacia GG4]